MGCSYSFAIYDEFGRALGHHDVDFRFHELLAEAEGVDRRTVRTVAPDLFARAVDAVLQTAKVEHAVLVGHSMGAPVLRQFYRKFPAKVRALVQDDAAQAQKLLVVTTVADATEWTNEAHHFQMVHDSLNVQTVESSAPQGGVQ